MSALTIDNASQQLRLDTFEPLLSRRINEWDAVFAGRRLEPTEVAMETALGRTADNELRRRLDELVGEEQRLLLVRDQRSAESVFKTEATEALGAALSFAIVIVVIARLRREIQQRRKSELAVREREQAIKGLNEDLERRVDERTSELKRANGELESFSYAVVHDLRAPLRGMASFADILLNDCEDTLSADTQDCLREIQQNAGKMAILIDALVAMSRITRGELKTTAVDLGDLTRVVMSELVTVDARGSLSLEVDEIISAELDPQLARMLLEILLGNAWKFTRKVKSAHIRVDVDESSGERVMRVRDNGAGFDMSHKSKLFTPFGRLHTVEEFQGAGIGLAIAKRIVERHGGRIWADARVDAGACFYFTLGPRLGAGAA